MPNQYYNQYKSFSKELPSYMSTKEHDSIIPYTSRYMSSESLSNFAPLKGQNKAKFWKSKTQLLWDAFFSKYPHLCCKICNQFLFSGREDIMTSFTTIDELDDYISVFSRKEYYDFRVYNPLLIQRREEFCDVCKPLKIYISQIWL